MVNQFAMRERNVQLLQKVCQMRSGFVQESLPQCSRFRAISLIWRPTLLTQVGSCTSCL